MAPQSEVVQLRKDKTENTLDSSRSGRVAHASSNDRVPNLPEQEEELEIGG